MKTVNYIVCFIAGIFILTSCDKYLDKTPEAEVTDNDIFGNYTSFQGVVDDMYRYIVDYNSENLVSTCNLGPDVDMAAGAATSAYNSAWGLYWKVIFLSTSQGNFKFGEGADYLGLGIWAGSWRGIRVANLTLKNLPLLKDATDEEKNLIAGQAYFFRAWFHWEIIKAFGGMPYVDTLFSADAELKFPRLTYQQTTERIVEDFTRAASLLPEDWDKTVTGGTHAGANAGRATKGAALAFKAKALLFAGSPLMNAYSGNDYTYDKVYMERAAEAAWEVIKLADKGVYALVPFSNYRDMFAKNDGTWPWTTETIFQKVKKQVGENQFTSRHGRVFSPSRFGGNNNKETVNQIFVDRFEMADGSRYKPEYDNDNARRWDDRDPRFRQNIIVDRDQWGLAAATVFQMYVGGRDKGSSIGMFGPYVVKKFWPLGVNTFDKLWTNYRWVTPHMRLADVYLIYAEAANEAYGAAVKAPGADLTAVDAINKIRARANMPAVKATADGYASFRELVQNERSVELCFEGNYWFDLRRWYLAHLDINKQSVDLVFDKNWTKFDRAPIMTRVFDNPKHYWLPIYREQTQLYKEFYQNPGW